jgi:chemotaxis protein CheC
VDVPNESQLDALSEVVNVGGGHAATALSRLVGGKRVQVELPRVSVRSARDAESLTPAPSQRVIAATFALEGDWSGRMLLCFDEVDGRRLSEVLLGASTPGVLGETQRSALAEAANIIASACLSAMGRLVGHRLVPSVPTMVHDAPAAVWARLWEPNAAAESLLILEARFTALLAPPLRGQLLILPDGKSVKAVLARMGV